jgi:hypothetical protein
MKRLVRTPTFSFLGYNAENSGLKFNHFPVKIVLNTIIAHEAFLLHASAGLRHAG